jgi:hypothetical protein
MKTLCLLVAAATLLSAGPALAAEEAAIDLTKLTCKRSPITTMTTEAAS